MAKILLIDSGIDMENKSFTISGGKNFLISGGADNLTDLNGHGTCCASVITKICPRSDFFIAKILDPNAAACSSTLIEALKYALQLNVKVINISLATIDRKYQGDMQVLCRKHYENGTIIISSVANRQRDSFPASLEGVIGVDGIFMNDSLTYWYNKNIRIQCVADLTPVMVHDLENTYSMFGGNSKAAALMTGHVANIINADENISVEEIQGGLQKKASVTKWLRADVDKKKIFPSEVNYATGDHSDPRKKKKILEEILLDFFQVPKEDKQWLYSNCLYYFLKPKDFFQVLQYIERELNIKLNYDMIKFENFKSIYTLMDCVFQGDIYE